MSERTSERSRAREQSEQSGASERVSGACKRAKGRASGPVLTSVFFYIFDHSDLVTRQFVSANSRTRECLLASVYLLRYSYMTLLAQVLVFFDFI